MIVVRILGWNTDRSWVDWSDYHRQYLEDRLVVLTNLDKHSARRISRGIRDHERVEVQLLNSVDSFEAESFRSFLESLGAVAVADDAEPTAAPNGGA